MSDTGRHGVCHKYRGDRDDKQPQSPCQQNGVPPAQPRIQTLKKPFFVDPFQFAQTGLYSHGVRPFRLLKLLPGGTNVRKRSSFITFGHVLFGAFKAGGYLMQTKGVLRIKPWSKQGITRPLHLRSPDNRIIVQADHLQGKSSGKPHGSEHEHAGTPEQEHDTQK